jgi:NAD(P)-dependent dehydrogenase (short-subunit alcohol dehydrogenase family)
MEIKMHPYENYHLQGKTAVITGGGGVLCSAMAIALAKAGVRVAVLDLRLELAQAVEATIQQDSGQALALQCDVLDKASLERAAAEIERSFGPADILINGAGGNHKMATTTPELSFFDLPPDAAQWVFNLNFIGTLLPTQVFCKEMAARGEGNVLNISSMNAFRPLTRIPAYSAAKAAISNFTQWLAVHLAQEYSPAIRVNALAPGFFLTEQNRFLLTDSQTGALTARGQKIIDHTPMARFGQPQDLLGAMFFLVSPASAFVTGVVVPIDGGFAAYSGV